MEFIRLFIKRTYKYCEFDRSILSKIPPLHTYAPQTIQTTTTTAAKKHGMGTILGGGRRSDFYSTLTEVERWPPHLQKFDVILFDDPRPRHTLLEHKRVLILIILKKLLTKCNFEY